MTGTNYIYLCEDSIEGIFTAIYQAWASKHGHKNNRIQIDKGLNYELFCEYIRVEPDEDLAMKVTKSIRKQLGSEVYEAVYSTAMSDYEGKEDVLYRFLIIAFHVGPSVIDMLSEESVGTVMKVRQRVWYEKHHFLGFLRFEELENTILCSRIRPKCNILTLVAPHFTDRLQNENFIIIDEGRQIAVVHPANKNWFLMDAALLDKEYLSKVSEKEELMKQSFATFVESISIKPRENKKLQRNMCPLRFREFMPEFQSKG